MASVATSSLIWTRLGSIAGAVGRDGSTPISFSITAFTTAMGHSVSTSNLGFSTMAVEPWTTIQIAPLVGGFCTPGSCSHGIGLLVS